MSAPHSVVLRKETGFSSTQLPYKVPRAPQVRAGRGISVLLSNITGFIPLLIELMTPQIILLTNFSPSNMWPYPTSHHLAACSVSTLVETSCFFGPLWSQELDLLIFLGPFQLGVLYDSINYLSTGMFYMLTLCWQWNIRTCTSYRRSIISPLQRLLLLV